MSQATIEFPQSVRFRLQASGTRPFRRVELEFGTDRVYSCATRSYSRVRLQLEPDSELDLSWEWQMKKTGSIPPGATIWWRWRLVDDGGRMYLSPRQELSWEDTRFQWSSFTQDNLTIYWYEGGSAFGEELAQAASRSLLALPVGGTTLEPIRAYVYLSPRDVKDAVLFAQEWTGGIAYPSYNILLIALPPDDVDSYERGLVHELAHLLVQEVSFNCFLGLPIWLDKGLASYAEGPMEPYMVQELARAIQFDGLISVRSLSSDFPASRVGSTRSYAQSTSLVAYLIGGYGWDKMRELLAEFRQGSTPDGALRKVYGFDMQGLDELWRRHVGAD